MKQEATKSEGQSPHHQDFCQGVAAMPICSMLSLFLVEMLSSLHQVPAESGYLVKLTAVQMSVHVIKQKVPEDKRYLD